MLAQYNETIGYNENSPKRTIYSSEFPYQKNRANSNNLIMHVWALGKKEQSKPKTNMREKLQTRRKNKCNLYFKKKKKNKGSLNQRVGSLEN